LIDNAFKYYRSCLMREKAQGIKLKPRSDGSSWINNCVDKSFP
jgi:hypothetical protein